MASMTAPRTVGVAGDPAFTVPHADVPHKRLRYFSPNVSTSVAVASADGFEIFPVASR
jgi:hypothetical protein